jgi:hypothetical protein
MAYIGSDVTTNASNTPGHVLANGTNLIIAREATVTAQGSSSEGVLGQSGDVFVFGEVFSILDAAIRLTSTSSVSVAEGAHVAGLTGVEFGGLATLTNDGSIFGDGAAIRGLGVAFRFDVFNTGRIHGGSDALLVNSGLNLRNSGVITADDDAITVSGDSTFATFIVNSGEISAGDRAIDLIGSDVSAEVVNTGRIQGLVLLTGDGDILDSTGGWIWGEIRAGGGGDQVLGSLARDRIFGEDGADTLSGAEGDDVLEGGAGGDELVGGVGFDVARYGGAGVTASLLDPGLNTGEAAGDEYTGVEGLIGTAFADLLVADDKANLLDGGSGVDTLDGGRGDDRYIVALGDVIVDSGGRDVAISFGSYSLGAGVAVEVVRTRADVSISLVGNELANRLVGGGGGDTLTGGDGADTVKGGDGDDLVNGGFGRDRLVGGAGADGFGFGDGFSDVGGDRIADFQTGEDKLRLNNNFFVGLVDGDLDPEAFGVIGGGALEADDRILFNPETGEVFYDSNGSGAGSRVLFATLQDGGMLTAGDILVV